MWKQVTHLSVFFVWNVLRNFEKRVLSFINDNEEVCPYWQEAHNGFVFQRVFFPTCLLYKFNLWEDIFSLPESNCYLFFFFFILKPLFVHSFLAVLGLRCCAQTFSTCGAKAAHCGSFSCCRAQSLGYTGFSSRGSLQRVETFWTRGGTHALCTSRWIPNPLGRQGSPRSFFFNVRIDCCNFLS